MTDASRWALAFFILAIATIVALLPRTEADDAATAPLSSEGKSAIAEDEAVLAPLRERAAMRPCPHPDPGGPKQAGPLKGISVPCLGTPGNVDLGATLAGRATLVNLWASWCGPCREEMPVLDTYADQPGAIDVLGVNVLDRTSSALEMVTELGVDYPSVYDPAEAVQRALRVPPVLPVNYLVKPDGTIDRITDPLIFSSPEQVHTAVQRHLAPKRCLVRLDERGPLDSFRSDPPAPTGPRIAAGYTRWTVVRGSDLEEGESQGLPVRSPHVAEPHRRGHRLDC